MIIRFFKFTKFPQIITSLIISFLIMLAFKDVNNLASEFYSLSFLIAIFFLSLFIISKNSILKNNQYIALGLITFCGIYFKMPSNISTTASCFFLLLSIRKIYSLNSNKKQNKKLFDIGFWFLISTILNPISLIFIITIFSGVFIFYKITVAVIFKILTGLLAASILIFFFYDLTVNTSNSPDVTSYIIDYISLTYTSKAIFLSSDYRHWLFASICLVTFFYYLFRFFGNNTSERLKNLFLLIFFINSILLVFVINEYSIFLFFPFLVTLIKIISEIRSNLFFEIAVLIVIILNSYPYNF